jgi:hypothetical protein
MPNRAYARRQCEEEANRHGGCKLAETPAERRSIDVEPHARADRDARGSERQQPCRRDGVAGTSQRDGETANVPDGSPADEHQDRDEQGGRDQDTNGAQDAPGRRGAPFHAFGGANVQDEQCADERTAVDRVVVLGIRSGREDDAEERRAWPRAVEGVERQKRNQRQHPDGDETEVSREMPADERRPAENDGREDGRRPVSRDAPAERVARDEVQEEMRHDDRVRAGDDVPHEEARDDAGGQRVGVEGEVYAERREEHRAPEWPRAAEDRPLRPPQVPDEDEVVAGAGAWNRRGGRLQNRPHPDNGEGGEQKKRGRVAGHSELKYTAARQPPASLRG